MHEIAEKRHEFHENAIKEALRRAKEKGLKGVKAAVFVHSGKHMLNQL